MKKQLVVLLILQVLATNFATAGSETESKANRKIASEIVMNSQRIDVQDVPTDQILFSHSQGQASYTPGSDDPKGLDADLTTAALSRVQARSSELRAFPTAWPSGQFVLWKIFLLNSTVTGEIHATCEAFVDGADQALPILTQEVASEGQVRFKIHFEIEGKRTAFELKNKTDSDFVRVRARQNAVCE